MPLLAELTPEVAAGRELTAAEVQRIAGALAGPEETEADKGAFLTALARRGETPAEVAAFAVAFRDRARDPGLGEWSGQAIDIVGTGGDHSGGFNVSSVVVLVLASAGVPVIKHGNRGITSRCGSADLLAGLGVDIEAGEERLKGALRELGFAFLFAPAYHPAFRLIAPVRRALAQQGQRTVFNILGPLINPGRPAHVLVGTFSPGLVPVLAGALDALGTRAGLVVHGTIEPGRGIDELTTATDNLVRGVGTRREVAGTWRAADFGLAPAPFADLAGGDLPENLARVESLLEGKAPRGLEDTVVLNAATGLWLTGRVDAVRAGLEPARDLLRGGAVRRKLAAVREFFRA
jgi:anthranilate phosphoribosyltransferase